MNQADQFLADLDHYEEREYPVSREDRIDAKVKQLLARACTVEGSFELIREYEFPERLLMQFAIWKLAGYQENVLGSIVAAEWEVWLRHCAESEVGE